jgi:hypothetical protein
MNHHSIPAVQFFQITKSSAPHIAAVRVLTAGSRVLLGKLIGSQLVKKFSPFLYTKIHYHIHNSTLPVLILSHLNQLIPCSPKLLPDDAS